MGGDNSKLAYRNIIIQLTTKTQPVDANDNEFWDAFWIKPPIPVQDMFALIPAAEIRALREESPNNLATLTYKAVERITRIADAAFPTLKDQQIVLNCVRLLTRLLPYMFEDPEWRTFFWSTLPTEHDSSVDHECIPLAQSLLLALSDLLFCPDFTVHSISKAGPECPEDMHAIDSCEYIWQAGVGFAQTQAYNATHHSNRTEILRLVLTCFSETMYSDSREDTDCVQNKWVTFFTSSNNRHALPLFASLLNTVCAYNPVGLGLPYNHLVFSDSREPLVEVAIQVLCVVLEKEFRPESPEHSTEQTYQFSPAVHASSSEADVSSGTTTPSRASQSGGSCSVESNLFANYMSRIHRDEDFAFILSGLTRLLNNPLQQTYLPGSTKKVQLHQELLVLFWRMCEINKKFMYFVLKSSQVLDLLVPILYYLSDARSDQARLGLVHVGVFILLLLSGERNFGVRLNKPYKHRVSFNLPIFTGTHADLLIIVFHHLIVSGHRRLQPLYDCLLTIIANVSPYLKSMSMVTANKLLHLLEVFSQPTYLYASRTHYQLVFLLLEVFNNIVQYQFDGNSNLVYTLIRKRHVFYRLANLPTEQESIQSVLRKQLPSAGSSPTIGSSQPNYPSELSHERASPEQKSMNFERAEDLHAGASKLSSNTEKPNFGPVFQATLAETPNVNHMTDQQIANVGTNGRADDAHNRPVENILISHSSPSQRNRALSETLSSADGSRGTTTYPITSARCDANGDSNPTTIESTADGKVVHPSENGNRTVASISKSHFPGVFAAKGLPAESDSAKYRCQRSVPSNSDWSPTSEWVASWKSKMPLQTIMRLLQVLVPQVEKICIDKGLTDESEIVQFLRNGTLVGLLPVPHPILIRKYQSNAGTAVWFRNYLWGIIYIRNVDPPIWYDTNIRLFEVQRV